MFSHTVTKEIDSIFFAITKQHNRDTYYVEKGVYSGRVGQFLLALHSFVGKGGRVYSRRQGQNIM